MVESGTRGGRVRPYTAEEWQYVLENDGRPSAEIAADLGRPKSSVDNMRWQLRKQGKLGPARTGRTAAKARQGGGQGMPSKQAQAAAPAATAICTAHHWLYGDEAILEHFPNFYQYHAEPRPDEEYRVCLHCELVEGLPAGERNKDSPGINAVVEQARAQRREEIARQVTSESRPVRIPIGQKRTLGDDDSTYYPLYPRSQGALPEQDIDADGPRWDLPGTLEKIGQAQLSDYEVTNGAANGNGGYPDPTPPPPQGMRFVTDGHELVPEVKRMREPEAEVVVEVDDFPTTPLSSEDLPPGDDWAVQDLHLRLIEQDELIRELRDQFANLERRAKRVIEADQEGWKARIAAKDALICGLVQRLTRAEKVVYYCWGMLDSIGAGVQQAGEELAAYEKGASVGVD
jgi:hypothetical protein